MSLGIMKLRRYVNGSKKIRLTKSYMHTNKRSGSNLQTFPVFDKLRARRAWPAHHIAGWAAPQSVFRWLRQPILTTLEARGICYLHGDFTWFYAILMGIYMDVTCSNLFGDDMGWLSCGETTKYLGYRKSPRNRCLAQQIAGEWMFTPQHNPIGIESSTYPLIVGGCGWIISIRITVDRRTAFSSLLVKSIFLIDFRYSHDFPCHF